VLTISGNVVSGNGSAIGGHAISINNTGSAADRSYVIQGNWIGTDSTGALPLGNQGYGIALNDKNVTVGGPSPARATSLPTTAAASCTRPDRRPLPDPRKLDLLERRVLRQRGPDRDRPQHRRGHPNDLGDADGAPGANDLQNFPIITSASPSSGTTHVVGKLNSLANTTFTIDFYSNVACVGAAAGFPRGTDVPRRGGRRDRRNR
jgi:hypothetical protein